jgi:hypothetical protein
MDVGDAEGATGEKYVGSPSATTRAMVAETSSGTVQLVDGRGGYKEDIGE